MEVKDLWDKCNVATAIKNTALHHSLSSNFEWHTCYQVLLYHKYNRLSYIGNSSRASIKMVYNVDVLLNSAFIL